MLRSRKKSRQPGKGVGGVHLIFKDMYPIVILIYSCNSRKKNITATRERGGGDNILYYI